MTRPPSAVGRTRRGSPTPVTRYWSRLREHGANHARDAGPLFTTGATRPGSRKVRRRVCEIFAARRHRPGTSDGRRAEGCVRICLPRWHLRGALGARRARWLGPGGERLGAYVGHVGQWARRRARVRSKRAAVCEGLIALSTCARVCRGTGVEAGPGLRVIDDHRPHAAVGPRGAPHAGRQRCQR